MSFLKKKSFNFPDHSIFVSVALPGYVTRAYESCPMVIRISGFSRSRRSARTKEERGLDGTLFDGFGTPKNIIIMQSSGCVARAQATIPPWSLKYKKKSVPPITGD